MQVLDGKNHHRGAYERGVPSRIVDLLNSGRYWGFLDHPDVSKEFDQQVVAQANEVFLKTFRALVDQWIDSGIDQHGIEIPSRRYVRGLPLGYSESLFDILHAWLGRNMPRPALMTEGKIAILDQPPRLDGNSADSYAREMAIYYLKELLDLPGANRIGRCSNRACGAYFCRRRQRNGELKRGSYCGRCVLIGAAERTKLSRERRKTQQLSFAAQMWLRWKKSRRHPDKATWIAAQVTRQFPNYPSVHRKWVTQNEPEILNRVQAQTVTY